MAQETNWRRAQTAGEALESIRQHSLSDAEKGLAFEALFSVVAQQAPELEVKAIYKLSEWAEASKYGLDGRDIGVDRVAILHSGERVAVQCKCYEDDRPVQKAEVQSFLAGSQNEAFHLRWLVTTSDLTGPVSQMLKSTNIRHLDFHQYSDTVVAATDSGRARRFPCSSRQ